MKVKGLQTVKPEKKTTKDVMSYNIMNAMSYFNDKGSHWCGWRQQNSVTYSYLTASEILAWELHGPFDIVELVSPFVFHRESHADLEQHVGE